MKKGKRFERAQALVIIAFGILGLVAFTGLSIDGGNVYADRRHAQNAADTSALAAALAKVKGENWKLIGDQRANSNGYMDTDTTSASTVQNSNVEIYNCTEAASDCGIYAGNAEYLQVLITSHVKTYFAPVVGIREMVNRVGAVAHAKPAQVVPWYNGNALVSLMPGCKPNGWPSDPFTISGNSTNIVGGSGVFVNSTCNNAINQNGTSSLTVTDGFSVCSNGEPSVANYQPGAINPPPTSCDTSFEYPPTSLIDMPNPSCGDPTDPANDGHIVLVTSSPRVWEAHPGNYFGGFPGVSPNGTLRLDSGIYCVRGGDFALHSSWTITTDSGPINGNPGDPSEGVLFYMVDGGVTMNGSSHITMNAIYNSSIDSHLKGVLFYLPYGNNSTIKLTGNEGSEFTGTIIAPSSLVEVEGSGATITVNSQIIGYSVETTGSGNINIYYDQGQNNLAHYNPLIQLAK